MANFDSITINDCHNRLYSVRDEANRIAQQRAKALIAKHAAKGLLRSGATLKGLASIVEEEFEKALCEILSMLDHVRSIGV